MRIFLLLLLLAHRPGAAQVPSSRRAGRLEAPRKPVPPAAIEPLSVRIPTVTVFRTESLGSSQYSDNIGISCWSRAWQIVSPQYDIYLNNVYLPDEAYIEYLHARLSQREIISSIHERIVSIKHLTGEELTGRYPALPQGVCLIKARDRRLTKAIRRSNRQMR